MQNAECEMQNEDISSKKERKDELKAVGNADTTNSAFSI